MKNKVYAVILVGGRGKRLRPLSSDSKPKAFLSVTKDRKTMFRKTVERLVKIVPRENILVVANRMHADLVRRDFPVSGENLLLEPVSRNTAPAIIYAASVLKKRGGDAVMVIIPTDQYIINDDKYNAEKLKKNKSFVSSSNVTMGNDSQKALEKMDT